MALTKEELDFLRATHRQLADKPLEPTDPLREPIHEVLDDADPVLLMQRHVDFNDVQSLQLFSGFRGAGKTTELFRLRGELRKQGYVVLYADAMEYVNPAEPVDIADMLMVIAGAFSDTLAKHPDFGTDIARESFWDRLKNFLTRTELRISGADARADYSSPGKAVLGGISAGLNIKAEIKTASSFRQNLQKFLSGHLVELKNEVDLFIEEGVKTVRAKHGEDAQIVFIFDSLEQLRGSFLTWKDVIRSVEQLFSVHIDRLRLPYVHTIYAVPPWLKFVLPSEAPMTVLPTVHLWDNAPDRPRSKRAWSVFQHLIQRRLKSDGIDRLFGPNGAAAGGPLDRLIGACGGHVRDLLRLMQETLKRATTLPVTSQVLDSVINATRRDLLPIALDDARWLRDIAESRDAAMPNTDERSVERLSNFLDTHRVIYFVNGSAWYDVHPLIRDEILRVIEAAERTAT